jgi:hypothetical protein
MRYTITAIFFILFLTRCNDRYPELGSGYKISGEGGYTATVVNSTNTVIISEYILDYAVDSNFILIAQSPTHSLPKMKIIYYSDNDRKEIAADKSVFRQYWIINKKGNPIYSFDTINQVAKYSNVYGPYNKNQYHEKRKILNIPEKLKLETE